MTIVEVLVAVGILGIVAAGTAGMMTQMLKSQNVFELRMTVQNISDSIRSYLTAEESWYQSIDGTCLTDLAGDFNCKSLVEAGGDAKKVKLLQVKDSKGNVKFDFTDAKKGFTRTGESCSEFGVSDKCPIGVKVTWLPDTDLGGCDQASCKRPAVKVQVNFEYEMSSNKVPFNISRYDFEIHKPGTGLSLDASCVAIGGTFDDASGKCQLPNDVKTSCEAAGGRFNDATQTCDLPSQVKETCRSLGGDYDPIKNKCSLSKTINSAMRQTCLALGGKWDGSEKSCTLPTKSAAGQCPQGQIMTGIDAKGQSLCAPLFSVLPTCKKNETLEGYTASGEPICTSTRTKPGDTKPDQQGLAPGAGPYPSYLNGRSITFESGSFKYFAIVENGWPKYSGCSPIPNIYLATCGQHKFKKGESGYFPQNVGVASAGGGTAYLDISLYGAKFRVCTSEQYDDGGGRPCTSWASQQKSWAD